MANSWGGRLKIVTRRRRLDLLAQRPRTSGGEEQLDQWPCSGRLAQTFSAHCGRWRKQGQMKCSLAWALPLGSPLCCLLCSPPIDPPQCSRSSPRQTFGSWSQRWVWKEPLFLGQPRSLGQVPYRNNFEHSAIPGPAENFQNTSSIVSYLVPISWKKISSLTNEYHLSAHF